MSPLPEPKVKHVYATKGGPAFGLAVALLLFTAFVCALIWRGLL